MRNSFAGRNPVLKIPPSGREKKKQRKNNLGNNSQRKEESKTRPFRPTEVIQMPMPPRRVRKKGLPGTEREKFYKARRLERVRRRNEARAKAKKGPLHRIPGQRAKFLVKGSRYGVEREEDIFEIKRPPKKPRIRYVK